MEDQQDDRISHFINEQGLRSDQKVMLGILEEIETVIKRIGDTKLSLFGTLSISQTARDIQSLAKSYEQLAIAKKNVADASIKEATAQLQVKRGETQDEKTRLAASRADKVASSTTKQVQKKSVPQGVDPAVAQEAQGIEFLSQKYNDLIAQKERLRKTGGENSGEFTLLSKKAEEYRQELLALIGDNERFKASNQSAFNAGAKALIDIHEQKTQAPAGLNGKSITDFTTQAQGIQNLKNQLQDIVDQQNLIKKNGDTFGTSALFTKLGNQADQLRQQIIADTEQLGVFITQATQPAPKQASAFEQLRKQAKQAKDDFLSLQTISNKPGGGELNGAPVTDRMVEDAKQKWMSLENQIKQTQVSAKAALNPPKEVSPFEQLVRDTKDAENAYKSLVARRQEGEDISDAQIKRAEKNWTDLKSKITEVGIVQRKAAETTPSNVRQDEIADLIIKIKAASAASEDLQRSLKPRNQFQTLLSTFSLKPIKEAKAGIKELDQQILALFNDLKQRAPAVAELVSHTLILPKGVQQQAQAATAVTGGATPSGQQGAGSAASTAANMQANIAAAEALDGVYARLQQRLLALQAEAQDLIAKRELGLVTPDELLRIEQVTRELGQLQGTIGKVDAVTGRAGRNQATYARQFFSLQQVLRETPSLAFGWSTFVSAISNNLPILADDIKRVSDANKEIAAQGGKADSVIKSLAKSFFSWQTLLLVGISILAIYADEIKDWVVALFRTEEANRRAYLSSQKFANTMKAESEIIKDLADSYKRLSELKTQNAEIGLSNLQNELKILQSQGTALQFQFDMKTKIKALETSQTNTNAATTFQSLNNQLDIVKQQTNITADRIKFLEKDITAKEKTIPKVSQQNLTVTKLEPGQRNALAGPTPLTSTRDQVAALKLELDAQKKIQELDNQALRFKENTAKAIKQIDDDVAANKISAEEAAAKKITAINTNLLLQQGVAQEKTTVLNDIQIARDKQATILANKLQAKNKDATKDPDFKKLQTDAQTAKTDVENQKKLSDELKETIIKNDADVANERDLAAQKAKDASDQLKEKILSNSQAELDSVKRKNNAILNDDRSTQKARLEAVALIANATKKNAEIEFGQAKRQHDLLQISDAQFVEAQNKLSTTIKDADSELAQQRLAIRQQFLQRRLAAEKQAEDAELGLSTDTNAKILDNEETSLKGRIEAIKRIFINERAKLEDDLRRQLEEAGLNKPQIETFIQQGPTPDLSKLIDNNKVRKTMEEFTSMYKTFQIGLVDLSRDSAEKQLKAIQDSLRKEESLYEDTIQNIERIFDKADISNLMNFTQDEQQITRDMVGRELLFKDFKERQALIEAQYNIKSLDADKAKNDLELKEAEKHYSEQLENEKAFELAKLRLKLFLAQQALDAIPNDKQHQQEREQQQLVVEGLQKQVAAAQAEFDAIKAWGDKIIGFKKKKAELEKQYAENTKQALEDEVGNLEKNIQALAQAFDNFTSTRFEERKRQIQEEMDLIDQRVQKETDAANQSITNEDLRQKRITELQEQGNQEKAALAAQQHELDVRKFNADKNAALLGIAIKLSETLAEIALRIAILNSNPATKIYTPIAIAQIPIAIAAAGLQTAAILSKQPPKLALGTTGFKGGRVIMGDAYRSELVEEPSGKMWVTAKEPTEYVIPKGTKVYPDADREIKRRQVTEDVHKMTETKQLNLFTTSKRDNFIRNHYVDVVDLKPAKPRLHVPELSKPFIPEDSVLEYFLNAQAHIHNSYIISGKQGDTKIDMSGITELNRDVNSGFSLLIRTIREKPVVSLKSTNRDMILKFGNKVNKYL